jgi:hypothetical protein
MIGYYVTLRRDSDKGTSTAWLLGPFAEHEAALAAVKEAADKAEEIDPRCFWDARGTSSITAETLPAGKLNSLLPHLIPA